MLRDAVKLDADISLAVTEIHQANITITKPVGGENPDISPVSSESEKYYADVDTWDWMYVGSATPIGVGGTFQTHEQYSLRVIFRTKSGYTFADDCVFTINGETTGCYSMDGNEFRYVYWYVADPHKPTYTVSFDADGGTDTMADVTDVFADYKLPACTFTAPVGKFFTGWFVGGYMKDPGVSILVFKDTNVLACWKNIPAPGSGYSVTYDGGAAVTAQTIEEGKKATEPSAPTKDGFVFNGWTFNGSAYDFNTAVNGNITLVAAWKPIPAGHTCNIKPVQKDEPSCTEGGKEAYYKCEGCGKFYEDALGTKEITDLAAWGNINKLDHKDDNNDGKCDLCRGDMGTGNNSGVQSPQTGDNGMLWLWIALMFISGGAIVSVVAVYKKKQTK